MKRNDHIELQQTDTTESFEEENPESYRPR